jgi:ribosomal protein S18 acetylase RimI-like enzyme
LVLLVACDILLLYRTWYDDSPISSNVGGVVDAFVLLPTTTTTVKGAAAAAAAAIHQRSNNYSNNNQNAQDNGVVLSVAITSSESTSSSSSGTTTTTTSTAATTPPPTTAIPFLIEEIRTTHPSDQVLQEICAMCIQAFFNDGPTTTTGTTTDKTKKGFFVGRIPWYKQVQLWYLQNLQQADLKRRRYLCADTNRMFVARAVRPVTTSSTLQRTPLILDNTQIYNLPTTSSSSSSSSAFQNNDTMDYCRGEVLGFVEVTLRTYGGTGTTGTGTTTTAAVDTGGMSQEESTDVLALGDQDGVRLQPTRPRSKRTERPVLTNLSVKYEARKSGVGSKLLQQCEKQVLSKWQCNEILLEVEDDNETALQFYTKRGYKVVWEDPTCRRYDTNGFFLRQVRCRRKVLRKVLYQYPSNPQQSISSAMIRMNQHFQNNNWMGGGPKTWWKRFFPTPLSRTKP